MIEPWSDTINKSTLEGMKSNGDAPMMLVPTLESFADGEIVEDAPPPKPFSTLSAMGVGHSISNTAITILVGLPSGLALGGGPLYLWTFLSMAAVGMCAAVSLGELASAMPHPGGQYYWVARLSPARYRRFAAYMTGVYGWAGAVCTGTSVCLTVPQMALAIISLQNHNFVSEPWMLFIGFQLTNLVSFGINCFEKLLPLASQGTLFFTISALVVLFSCTLAKSSPANLGSAFLDVYNVSGWSNGISFLIGVNGVNWGFSCLDAAVHLADEIPEPQRNIPKALLWTVGLGALTGFPITLSFFSSVSDISVIANSTLGVPSLEAFYQAWGQNIAAATALQLLVLISVFGAMIGIQNWQARIAWAFSRDRGFPFHTYQEKIAPKPFEIPFWAHVWSSTWTALLGCIQLGSSTALGSFISAGILLQYITYSTAILFMLYRGRNQVEHGPFWYRRFGPVANTVTVIWTIVSLIFYCFPYYMPVQAAQMNYVACVLVGITLWGVAYWYLYGKSQFICATLDDADD